MSLSDRATCHLVIGLYSTNHTLTLMVLRKCHMLARTISLEPWLPESWVDHWQPEPWALTLTLTCWPLNFFLAWTWILTGCNLVIRYSFLAIQVALDLKQRIYTMDLILKASNNFNSWAFSITLSIFWILRITPLH